MKREIEAAFLRGATGQQLARAAYPAICLDLAETLQRRYPDEWSQALVALRNYPRPLAVLFNSPTPAAEKLRKRATAAGLESPQESKR